MEGQINPESSFGKAIIEIASDTTYKTFLDVGTWNGMGTTRCLVNALKGRNDTMIYSVEANRDMFNKATKNWENMPSNLKLLYGKICKDMMTYEEIVSSPLFPGVHTHFMLHYGQDSYDFLNAPLVSLPSQIDVVILDGGEFCGKGDLSRALTVNPKVIALDDTECMKNNENLKMLLDSSEWTCLQKNNDRNGWAVFRINP